MAIKDQSQFRKLKSQIDSLKVLNKLSALFWFFGPTMRKASKGLAMRLSSSVGRRRSEHC